ncbi:MAG: hypothetical protein WD669_13235 [Pirellulales bacterium]
MVRILPPAGWRLAAEDGSQAATPTAAPVETFTRITVPSQAAADEFAAAAVAALEGGGPIVTQTTPAVVKAAPAAAPVPAGVNALVAKLLASPATIAGGASVAAVLLIGGLAIALWPRADASESSSPPIATTNQSPVFAAQPPASEAGNDGAAQVATTEPTSMPPSEPSAPAKFETAIADPPITRDVPSPIAITNDNHPRSATAVSEPDNAVPTPPPAAPIADGGASSRVPVLKIDPLDPLDFDPSRLMLPMPATSNNASLASGAASASPGEAASAAGDAGAALSAKAQAQAAPDEDPTITVRRGPPSAQPLATRDVAAQLALPIRSMNMRAVPLARLLDTLSDMAGVPISLDPSALELTGVSPRREVAIDAKDTSIERVLRDVLGRQRLDFAAKEGRLVVIGPNAELRRPRDYDVADLVKNAGEAAKLAERIQRFVATESWEAAGGAGTIAVNGTTLHVEQTDREHVGILVFLERLRLSRGLPPKSRYPIERLSVDSPYGRLSAKLNTSTTFTFVPWTRLADVVRDWHERSGVMILVDWKSLAQVELTPASPVSCSAIHRSWEDALDGILAPLDLSWWAVDGETIQITSRAAVERLRRVEFFAIPQKLREQFAGDAALVDSLQKEIREHAKAADGDSTMDVDGQRLIVTGNAGVHRFLTRRLAGE